MNSVGWTLICPQVLFLTHCTAPFVDPSTLTLNFIYHDWSLWLKSVTFLLICIFWLGNDFLNIFNGIFYNKNENSAFYKKIIQIWLVEPLMANNLTWYICVRISHIVQPENGIWFIYNVMSFLNVTRAC